MNPGYQFLKQQHGTVRNICVKYSPHGQGQGCYYE